MAIYDIVIVYILDKGGQYCNNFMYMVNLERNNIIILIMFNVRRNVQIASMGFITQCFRFCGIVKLFNQAW